jgi:hypothetical protein
MSILVYTRKTAALAALLLCGLQAAGQYCTPTSRHPQVQAVLTGIMLEGIANTNTLIPLNSPPAPLIP